MDIPRLWGTHRVGIWQMRPVGQIWLVFVSKVLWNAVLPTGLIWSLAAFCLAAVQASGEVTPETETSGPLQKSLLMPVLEPCYSKKDLWSSSRSTWGVWQKCKLSGPIPDPQNQNLPLKKVSGDSHTQEAFQSLVYVAGRRQWGCRWRNVCTYPIHRYRKVLRVFP